LDDLKISIEDRKTTFPFVWKCTEFGYDGYGVKIIREASDLNELPDGECIAEQLIPFKNELAVIVVRNLSGETKTYPVVEMEFHPEANQVEYVICPARIDEKIAQKATEIALKVAEVFEPVGLLAVENVPNQLRRKSSSMKWHRVRTIRDIIRLKQVTLRNLKTICVRFSIYLWAIPKAKSQALWSISLAKQDFLVM